MIFNFKNIRLPKVEKSKIYIALVLLFIVFGFISCKRRYVSPTSDMDAPDNYWVRVLLFNDTQSCKLEFDSGFEIKVAGKTYQDYSTAKDIKVAIGGGKFVINEEIVDGEAVWVKPKNPYVFTINKQSFRGNLKLVMNSGGKSFDAINYLPVEAYLKGVVGAEMPNYWQEEALKTQAVAARTYCLYYKKTYGDSKHYDMRRTQANQVYKGVIAENKRTDLAIEQTAGQVLLSDKKLFPSYYSSICGGYTESAENVFGKGFGPLQSVKCSNCVIVAKRKQYFWKPVKFSVGYVNQRLAGKYASIKKLGQIVKIEPRKIIDYGNYSRWTSVKLTSKSGKSITLKAEDLRLTIDPTGRKIKSTIFELLKQDGKWVFYSGRGFGHGVGLCQCGAQKLAREGKSYKEILNYYYPGADIEKLF